MTTTRYRLSLATGQEMHAYHLRLPRELWQRLEARCQAEGVSINLAILQAVEAWMAEEREGAR